MLKIIKPPKNGYQQLKYIESNGLQGFNTGLTASATDIIEIRGRFTDLSVNQWLCGTHDGRTYRKVLCVMTKNNQTKFTASAGALDELNDGTWNYCGSPVMNADTNTHTFIFNQSDASITIDGVRYALVSGGGVPTIRHMPLFCNYHDTEQPVDCAYFQMEYAKFTQGGVLVRNYIPKTRLSDGISGMFDKVNNEFYVSQTDTPFIAGCKALGNITALYKKSESGNNCEQIQRLYKDNHCIWIKE